MVVLTLLVLVVSAAPSRSHAETVLRQHCLVHAADAQNPWAMAHGILAFGARFSASDGRPAVDAITHDFLLREFSASEPPSKSARYSFARFAPDNTPIEPHPNLLAKTFVVDARLPLTRRLETPFGALPLSKLVESVRLRFHHAPSVPEYWHHVGWTLDLFAATSKPGDRFVADDGATIEIDKVMDDAITELERETVELRAALTEGRPRVDKRRQGLYAHSCGGLHFVQGIFSWARHPSVAAKWRARLEAQVAIHFYRLESERSQYDEALQKAITTAPAYRVAVLIQMVKFYGHFLETAARFRGFKWRPTEEQSRSIFKAKAYLDSAVRDLTASSTFESMATLKKQQPQLYLDLIGDSCHAAHGLEAWP
jgi:hypothetical protein